MDDIEDTVAEFTGGDSGNRSSFSLLQKGNYTATKHTVDVEEHKVAVPGTQKIFIKTYGCSHNVSDSEYMEGILSQYGYRITQQKDEADLWLINSCTVKDPSQAAFMHLVNTGWCFLSQ